MRWCILILLLLAGCMDRPRRSIRIASPETHIYIYPVEIKEEPPTQGSSLGNEFK
jgi:hypothetical protein